MDFAVPDMKLSDICIVIYSLKIWVSHYHATSHYLTIISACFDAFLRKTRFLYKLKKQYLSTASIMAITKKKWEGLKTAPSWRNLIGWLFCDARACVYVYFYSNYVSFKLCVSLTSHDPDAIMDDLQRDSRRGCAYFFTLVYHNTLFCVFCHVLGAHA